VYVQSEKYALSVVAVQYPTLVILPNFSQFNALLHTNSFQDALGSDS